MPTYRTFTFNVVAPQVGMPAYMGGPGGTPMADLSVRNLTGAYAPSNGKTTLFSVQPTIWQVTGQPNGADMVFSAWCGGDGDAAGRKLYVHGGGHGDSANNGLHIYDFAGTTAPTGWSIASSSQSQTIWPRLQDEPVGGRYPDGLPYAIHSYDQQRYDPARRRFYRHSGSPSTNNGATGAYAFYYDFDTSTWVQLGARLKSAQSGDAWNEGSIGGSLILAPDGSGKVCAVTGSKGVNFTTPDGTRTYAGATPWPGDDDANYSTAYDSTNQRYFALGRIGLTQIARTFTINWSAGSIGNFTSPTVTKPDGGGFEGCSIVYDDAHSQGPCFWVFGNYAGGVLVMEPALYRIDANTFATTKHSFIGGSDSIALANATYYGNNNRHVWFSAWRIIAMVASHSAPVSLIKVPT